MPCTKSGWILGPAASEFLAFGDRLMNRGWLLLAISARIARTSWKYDSIAYSVMLKEVGCLMQTLYLAAGALGLGACALGSGPLDLLPRVTGVDALLEPQVGEIVIGRPRLRRQ